MRTNYSEVMFNILMNLIRFKRRHEDAVEEINPCSICAQCCSLVGDLSLAYRFNRKRFNDFTPEAKFTVIATQAHTGVGTCLGH